MLCLLGSDCVFRGLGHTELHDSLGLDLDWFAGLRVAAHAGFAVGLHQAAQSGDYEYPVLFGLFDRGISEMLQERCRLFVVDFELLGHVADEGCLGHTCCHESSLAGLLGFECETSVYLNARRGRRKAFSPVSMRVFASSRWIPCDYSQRVSSGKAHFPRFFCDYPGKNRKLQRIYCVFAGEKLIRMN